MVKVLSDSSAGTMCIKQISSLVTKEIEFIVLCSIPTAIFSCPAYCFKWHSSHRRKASGVLGSPIGFITGRRASPTRIDATSHTMRGCPVSSVHTKGNYGRLHLHGETCHHFALFPYLHPSNKVKPGNVTEKCHTDGVKR